MAGNPPKPSTNLLFSSGNDFNLGKNTFFLPQKTSQNSPMMQAEEEDSFVGQNSSSSALFNSSSSANDPFASVGIQQGSLSENEPQLFVPSSPSPPPGNLSQHNPLATACTTSSGTPLSSPYNPAPPFQSPPPNMHQNPYRTHISSLPHYVPAPGMSPSSSRSYTPPVIASAPSSIPPSLSNLSDNVRPPPMHSYNSNVTPHWCYSKTGVNGSLIWYPFSFYDSSNLEKAYNENLSGCIQTDGGRYDVNVAAKIRRSVYWQEPESQIRRCTWFFKTDNSYRYVPYVEDFADQIEQEYKAAIAENSWQKQVTLDTKNIIVFHNPQVMVHLQPLYEDNENTVISQKQMSSQVIKRGINDIDLVNEIPESEIDAPDHLVLIVFGIGPSCDKHKSIVEYVDEFRAIQLTLLKSHFKHALESKRAVRIEFLPVHWYHAMLGEATNIDQEIRNLTLPSISRLRQFKNESMLDLMFYNSPVYCQTIADTVCTEANSMYNLFKSRSTGFHGNVTLVGHSLGSLIIFDILSHQADAQKPGYYDDPVKEEVSPPDPVAESPPKTEISETLENLLQKLNLQKFESNFNKEQIDFDSLLLCSESDLKDIGLPLGPRKKLMGYVKEIKAEAEKKKEQALIVPEVQTENASINHVQRLESVNSFFSSAMNVRVDYSQFDSGVGQPLIKHSLLDFQPTAFFAIGSPIGLILTLRGASELGLDFTVGECHNFYNLFHPFDPMAYRIEPLINPEITIKPALVPHHKGRKRLHLQLQESLGRMGVELKQGIINSVRKAMGSLQRYWNQKPTAEEVEEHVTKVTEELLKEGQDGKENDDAASVISDNPEPDIAFGKINSGKRVDYVLQERPLESFNDYLFAFQSHNCYWTNEDTALLIIKEIYSTLGVDSDRQVEKHRRLQQQPLQMLPTTNAQPQPPLQ